MVKMKKSYPHSLQYSNKFGLGQLTLKKSQSQKWVFISVFTFHTSGFNYCHMLVWDLWTASFIVLQHFSLNCIMVRIWRSGGIIFYFMSLWEIWHDNQHIVVIMKRYDHSFSTSYLPFEIIKVINHYSCSIFKAFRWYIAISWTFIIFNLSGIFAVSSGVPLLFIQSPVPPSLPNI